MFTYYLHFNWKCSKLVTYVNFNPKQCIIFNFNKKSCSMWPLLHYNTNSHVSSSFTMLAFKYHLFLLYFSLVTLFYHKIPCCNTRSYNKTTSSCNLVIPFPFCPKKVATLIHAKPTIHVKSIFNITFNHQFLLFHSLTSIS